MTQRVPSWDLEESCHDSARLSLHADSSSAFDHEVAELTWENGHLAMHGLGTPKAPLASPVSSKYSWEKPRAGGTLECIVDQAASLPLPKRDELLPWFENHLRAAAMDALVPCSNRTPSTRVGSCSGSVERREAPPSTARKRTRVSREWSSGDRSMSLSASASRHVTMDTCEVDANVSLGSREPTSLRKPLLSRTQATSVDDHDSVCHSKPQREEESGEEEEEEERKRGRSSARTKRSKAAAIHNQSERKRRDRINQKLKTLQKLVPNSSKTDKASMLDEVIEYLKQLQAQVQMMSKMSSIPQLMMPMAMQQLQMSMMAQMSMMGVMENNCLNRTGHGCHAASTPPVLHPAVFLPLTAMWGGSGERLPPPGGVFPDPLSAAFLACQTQPYNMDAHNRMAALYQQLQQSTGAAPPISKT